MTSLPTLTDRQREAAVTRIHDSLAMTSGAGCGKTMVLARRFTELLLAAGAADPDAAPLDRFVALTFTDKAALEMVGRVRTVLQAALAGAHSPADRKRLAQWMTQLPAARISTIHSFCASLLRRHAVEAQVDPGFAVCADELLTAQLSQEAAEGAVRQAVTAGRARAVTLLSSMTLPVLVGCVRELLGRRIAWRAAEYAEPAATLARWDRLRAQARRKALDKLNGDKAFAQECRDLLEWSCDEPADRLLLWRNGLEALLGKLRAHPDALTAGDLAGAGKAGNVGSARAWDVGREALTAYRRRLGAVAETLRGLAPFLSPLGDADAAAAEALAELTALAEEANELYRQAKRRRGLLDFDDLIDLTARLLASAPDVRATLRAGLDQLLLDEAQDTDSFQLQLLWRLLTDDGSPPDGSVFVVGDVKQSIYRFRGAQAEVFAGLVDAFGPRGQVPLDTSFRTHDAGVQFVNHVFSRLMSGYEPTVSSRTERPEGPGVEILLAEMPADGNAADALAAQAALLAQRIDEMVRGREKRVYDRAAKAWRPVRLGDIAILFGRMTQSLEFERALQQHALDYHVVAGTGFFQQQEVFDALNALRAVDNPADDVALVGVLRSGLFGLDDNVLLHLAQAGHRPYFDALASPAVLARLDPAAQRQLQFARDTLGRLHRRKDALGAAGVLEALLEQTGYAAVLGAQFHGRRKLGNVRHLLAAARGSTLGGGSLAQFVARYDELALDESRYEQAPVAGEGEDVLRLMTIHKAKGLEFPVVILPDLNAGSGHVRDALLFRQDWQWTFKPPPPPDADEKPPPPVSFALAAAAENEDLAQEEIRRLYVATTRHEDYLLLLGADWRSDEGRVLSPGCALSRLDEALGLCRALDAQADRIAYGPYHARLERRAPQPPPRRRRSMPLLERQCRAAPSAAALGAALARRAAPPASLPLAEALEPSPAGGPVMTVAPTVLADFEHCPKLYQLRYELALPREGGGPAPAGALDAATAGTVFHRCMQYLDFDADGPLQAQARPLVARVLAEMDLPAEPSKLAGEWADMLAALARTPLCGQLRAARLRLPEVSFLYRAGAVELAGQIDLLYHDAGGAWHVLDYKSDRVGPDTLPRRAEGYRLQMAVYLAAASRHLGQPVADATLYFLRPAAAHAFAADEAVAGLNERLAALADELARCRRSGLFPRRPDRCAYCPYRTFCRRAPE